MRFNVRDNHSALAGSRWARSLAKEGFDGEAGSAPLISWFLIMFFCTIGVGGYFGSWLAAMSFLVGWSLLNYLFYAKFIVGIAKRHYTYPLGPMGRDLVEKYEILSLESQGQFPDFIPMLKEMHERDELVENSKGYNKYTETARRIDLALDSLRAAEIERDKVVNRTEERRREFLDSADSLVERMHAERDALTSSVENLKEIS